MLAKVWKKILLIVLIIVCLWNIVNKLTKIISFDKTIKAAQNAIQSIGKEEKTNNTKAIKDKENTLKNNIVIEE